MYVCVSVRSFLPPRASRPRNIGMYVFTATRINYLSGGVVQVVNHKIINNKVLFNMHWE